MLLYDSFTIALRYSVKLPFSQFAREAILALFRFNPDEFMRWYITLGETWILHHTPETKEQSKQWIFEGERASKKAKSAGKMMATVF